jgi:cell division protein FtsB
VTQDLEQEKLRAEIQNISAQTEKLRSEIRKLERERLLYPVVVGSGLVFGLVGLVKLFN